MKLLQHIYYLKRQTKEINNTRKTHHKIKSHAHNLILKYYKLGLPYCFECVTTARVVLLLKNSKREFFEMCKQRYHALSTWYRYGQSSK